MLVTVAMLVLGVALCRLYRSDRERSWLLPLVSVAAGLVLLTLPELYGTADVLAGWLVEWARKVAEWSAPFLLVLVLYVLLWRLGRRWWRMYLAFGPLERGRVVLVSVSLGIAIASLLRVTPYLPDAARVAGEGARDGMKSGLERVIDKAGEQMTSTGGGAAP